ncbi:MAG: hypothetical protein LVO36_03845 [Nitrosopumilus sp. (ex Thoosa mismalolli)]|nr:hypothetical protein [Nitrosopumilus sp. (ex Thoosa mismalolli)]
MANLPQNIEDKIFEIKSDSGIVSRIKSYFPLSENEKQKIIKILNLKDFDGFTSIFTDTVSDEEWEKTKHQIKKKFRDELFDIDSGL